jgi:hypothetical protein
MVLTYKSTVLYGTGTYGSVHLVRKYILEEHYIFLQNGKNNAHMIIQGYDQWTVNLCSLLSYLRPRVYVCVLSVCLPC